MFSQALKSLYRVIMYTSIITGLQGIMRTLTVILVLGLRPDPVILAMIFGICVFVYGRDRIVGLDSDSKTDPRSKWIAKNQTRLKLVVHISGGIILLLAPLRLKTISLLAAILCLALAYNIKILPGGKSFKQLPGFKTPFVSAIWVALTAGLPLIASGKTLDERDFFVMAIVFLYMSTLISINDIYDITEDKANGVKSLAVLIGESNVRGLASVFSLVGAAIAAFSISSTGLFLAGIYFSIYAISIKSPRGRDHTATVFAYRASSFIMFILVLLFK